MTTHGIQYASSDECRARRKWPVGPLVAAALCPVLIASALVTVRHDSIEMDAISGSRRVVSNWPLGITTGGAVRASALEVRLNAMGQPWTRDWWCVNGRGYSIVGLQTSRGCGSAPPIYGMSPGLTEFVAAATDGEILAFFDVMQSGTETEQRDAMNVAIDIAFRPPVENGKSP